MNQNVYESQKSINLCPDDLTKRTIGLWRNAFVCLKCLENTSLNIVHGGINEWGYGSNKVREMFHTATHLNELF